MAPFLAEKMQVIRPLIPDATRPFWSVMIPTYNARANYLEETLKSVLQQDPGPEQMQIEVVDDCSLHGDPAELVANVDRIRGTLDWRPQFQDLDTIVAHAFAWERRLSSKRETAVA